jgi:hypothetical protein
MNPNRQAPVTPIAPIVISAVTHLPNLEDYHSERFDVIRCSLETMRANAGLDCEVLIWDNGSCAKLKAWLINDYKPDYLMFSRNVGLSIGRASIVNLLPPETIVAIADDDMFYYPDWLKKQIKVLDTYPKVGTVSGWPVRTQFRFHNKSTIAWGRKYGQLRKGRFISEQEERDFCKSVGRDYEGFHFDYTRDDLDLLLTYNRLKAYAAGHHCQFIGRVKTLSPLMRYDPVAMGSDRPFEKAIDEAGLLRLTTYERTTRHIGNILDKSLEGLWQKYIT